MDLWSTQYKRMGKIIEVFLSVVPNTTHRWAILNVAAGYNQAASDEVIMKAAGYLEGALTKQ